MPSSFPTSKDTFTTKVAHVSPNAAADVNNLQDSVAAIETALVPAGITDPTKVLDLVGKSLTLLASGAFSPTAVAGGFDPSGYVHFGGGPRWDVTHPAFGGTGNARWVNDAAITSGQTTLTSATATFTSADVGRAALVAGAGAAGATLATQITVFTNSTTVTVANAAGTTVSGANAMVANDNQRAFLLAINQQQSKGGKVWVPAGFYYCQGPIIPAIVNPDFITYATPAKYPLIIEGDGMASTSIIMGVQANFSTSGLFGNVNQVQAQLVLSDITLDGNYKGVSMGVIPQPPGTPGDALVALPWPFTNAFSGPPTAPTGQYHVFTRVRFYRPHQFTFQPCQGVLLDDCVFDQCGQPDIASGGLHWDNLGSSNGDAIVLGCSWKDSSGNYADFVPTSAAVSRIIMIGNVSRNHQIGSMVACGTGSIVAFNRLANVNAGSGIGYDASQPANTRSKNYVFGNILDNLTVNNAGLSFAVNGDVVWGNISSDSVGLEIQQGYLNLVQAIGNVNNPAVENVLNFGDKIAIGGGAGAGGRYGLGLQSGALVAFLSNNPDIKFRIAADPGGTAQGSTGTELFGWTANSHHNVPLINPPVSTALGANVTSVTAAGNDYVGTIAVVMAGALAANTRIATLTFARTYGATSPYILLTNQTSGAGLAIVNFYATPSTGVSFDLFSNQPLAAGTYTLKFLVIGVN